VVLGSRRRVVMWHCHNHYGVNLNRHGYHTSRIFIK
jgi:hypothetical protein